MMFQSVSEMLGTDELLTPADFAAAAGMHKRTLMKKVHRGEIPWLRISKRKILIPTRALTEQHVSDVEAHVQQIADVRLGQSVYFIQASSGPIKIGIAIDPVERLAGLQISHFDKLRMLVAVDGGIRLETALHQRFAHLRIRGEWFRPAPELLAEIENYLRTAPHA